MTDSVDFPDINMDNVVQSELVDIFYIIREKFKRSHREQGVDLYFNPFLSCRALVSNCLTFPLTNMSRIFSLQFCVSFSNYWVYSESQEDRCIWVLKCYCRQNHKM